MAADGAKLNNDEDVAAYLRMLGRIWEGIGNQMGHCLQVIKTRKVKLCRKEQEDI